VRQNDNSDTDHGQKKRGYSDCYSGIVPMRVVCLTFLLLLHSACPTRRRS
jgi:hypothetical protein